MIDWSARIDELAYRLDKDFSVNDRVALEVLLSAMIDCPRTPPVWLVLETSWFDRGCMDAWFSFGKAWLPQSLLRLRGRGPWRVIETEVLGWLENPAESPRLFVEPDYSRYPYFPRATQTEFILRRAPRLRMRAARTTHALDALDEQKKEARDAALLAATNFVLKDSARLRAPDPPRFRPPENFSYHLEVLQRLTPWYDDWDALVLAFAALAVRHAYLFDRRETGPEDYLAIARVAADSVPVWITKALLLLAKGPTKPMTIERAMLLEDKTRRSGHGPTSEMRRLRRAAIVDWNASRSWSMNQHNGQAALSIIEGRGFSALAACA